jgi:hypothetical protein
MSITRAQEATFGRVLDGVARVLAFRSKRDRQSIEVQQAAWNIVNRHHALVEIGITLRSAAEFVVGQVIEAQAEVDA